VKAAYGDDIFSILWPVKKPDPILSFHNGSGTIAQEFGFRLQFTSDQYAVGG
jgi:hypothetical protein